MPARVVLVTGATGRTGQELVPLLRARGHAVHTPGRGHLDLARTDHIADFVDEVAPDVVVNLAAVTDLEACALDPDLATAVNGIAVEALGHASEKAGAHLIQVSTDYVFDGTAAPYGEHDMVAPINDYGHSKLLGERSLGELTASRAATVVRTAWVSGTTGPGLVRTALDAGRSGRPLQFVDDQWSSPTSAIDLARLLADVVEQQPGGILHGANAGRASRYDVVRWVLETAGHDPDLVSPVPATDRPSPAGVLRPRDTHLVDTRLGALGIEVMRGWQEAYADLTAHVLAHGDQGP